MTSLDNLPIEILEKVADMIPEVLNNVNERLATKENHLRRRTLINLALVSKRYTLPAQQALWYFIDLQNEDKRKIMNAIRHGYGRNKKVKRLEFNILLTRNARTIDPGAENMLLEFLSGIRVVVSLSLGPHVTRVVHHLRDVLLLPSLQRLNSLELCGADFTDANITLPSALQTIKFQIQSQLAIETFFPLLGRLNTTIDSLILTSSPPFGKSREPIRAVVEYLRIQGSNLRSINLKSLHSRYVLTLLPLTPSLTSIVLPDSKSIKETKHLIEILPLGTRLISLDIGKSLLTYSEPSVFFSFFDALQLSQLRYFYLTNARFDDTIESYDFAELDAYDSKPEYLRAEEVCQAIELLKERGIQFYFQSSCN